MTGPTAWDRADAVGYTAASKLVERQPAGHEPQTHDRLMARDCKPPL